MIPAALLDHEAAIWRHRESKGSTYRETRRKWDIVAEMDRVGLLVEVVSERREERGGGEHVEGEYKLFGSVELDVCEGDVVELREGPEAPKTLLVDAVKRPGRSHAELVARAWNGKLDA